MQLKHFATNCQSVLYSILVSSTLVLGLSLNTSAWAEEEKKVNVWNWSDYIASDTIENFTKETGITTNYVMYDSPELVEARMLSGHTGFDAIMMTSYYIPRLAKAGALQKIDKSLLSNYQNLDPKRMAVLEKLDPNNAYAIPYAENTLGIGYNEQKIQEIFGSDFKLDSFEKLLNPENAAKLKKCGIAILDGPFEIVMAIQKYLNKDLDSEKKIDYLDAKKLLTSFAKNVAYFHSSRFINDLASGDICVAVGYSGDILQANDRAKAAKRNYTIKYEFPQEGSLLWYDCWVLPIGAPHLKNAHIWFNNILNPDVAKSISDEIRYIVPVSEAIAQLDHALINNPSVNLSPELLEKAYLADPPSARKSKLINEVWNYMKLNSVEEESGWE